MGTNDGLVYRCHLARGNRLGGFLNSEWDVCELKELITHRVVLVELYEDCLESSSC